ncbi:glutathione transferase GstA [Chitinilyticum piscinae]|uniref:Glutathione transferase GstA n=1 Tax=Chitinilyticum piscinae TaxID=2866724 RepID=A0A8J7FF97_9NEIS|nr:glutathione transferase GstA [Chitinilyticum piscinae]MBE9608313.1 glutathione transferase GstA [Chitinilyticum piscinae]
MKLYYFPGASSLSVHIALAETGLEYTLERVDFVSHRTEDGRDFYTVNPLGCVPALELPTGEILTEGAAIVQYLADLVPEKHLAPPNGTLARYRLQAWLNFLASEIHQSLGPFFSAEVPDKSKTLLLQRLAQRFGILEQELGRHDYLLREFTVADGYLFTLLGWCDYLKIDLSPYPVLQAFQARIALRPAVQRALQEEGLL